MCAQRGSGNGDGHVKDGVVGPRQAWWSAEDRSREQGPCAAHHEAADLLGEPMAHVESGGAPRMMGVVSRVQCSSPRKPLTSWRAEKRRRERRPNAADYCS